MKFQTEIFTAEFLDFFKQIIFLKSFNLVFYDFMIAVLSGEALPKSCILVKEGICFKLNSSYSDLFHKGNDS